MHAGVRPARNLQKPCRFFHLVQRAHLQPAHQVLHIPLSLAQRRRSRRTHCIRRAQHVCCRCLGVRPVVSGGAAATGAISRHGLRRCLDRVLMARLRLPAPLCQPGARRHHAAQLALLAGSCAHMAFVQHGGPGRSRRHPAAASPPPAPASSKRARLAWHCSSLIRNESSCDTSKDVASSSCGTRLRGGLAAAARGAAARGAAARGARRAAH